MPQSNKPIPSAKWVKGVSPKHSLHKAAHRILRVRLSAVWHWLTLAAQRSDENVEHVHQLRVSTRRAVEAMRVFSDLISKSAYKDLIAELRQLRRAADEARNLDVLCAEFLRYVEESCDDDTCRQIAEAIRYRRQEAQQPIETLHQQLVAGNFNEQVAELLEGIKTKGKEKSRPVFGKQAPGYLKPVLKEFFKASQADLSDDEAFHNLRLHTKNLRYRMEIVATAFEPDFRKKLYRQISALQDIMGTVNDHATAKTFFGDWIEKTEDAQQKVFFQGILLAEIKAHQDLRQAFHAIWTPKAVKKLKRQFRAYCGMP